MQVPVQTRRCELPPANLGHLLASPHATDSLMITKKSTYFHGLTCILAGYGIMRGTMGLRDTVHSPFLQGNIMLPAVPLPYLPPRCLHTRASATWPGAYVHTACITFLSDAMLLPASQSHTRMQPHQVRSPPACLACTAGYRGLLHPAPPPHWPSRLGSASFGSHQKLPQGSTPLPSHKRPVHVRAT